MKMFVVGNYDEQCRYSSSNMLMDYLVFSILIVVNLTFMYMWHSMYCERHILTFLKTSEECAINLQSNVPVKG